MKIVKKDNEYIITCAHGFVSKFSSFKEIKPLCKGCPCAQWVLTEVGEKEKVVFFHCHGGPEPFIGSEPYCKEAEHTIKILCCKCVEFYKKVLLHLPLREIEYFLNLCKLF